MKQKTRKRAKEKVQNMHVDTLLYTEESHKNTKPLAIIYTQRTCKVIKTKQIANKNPDTTLEDKQPPKMPIHSFYVGYLQLGKEQAFKSRLFPQWDSIEEN